jgi:ribosome-associated protein
LNVNELTNRIRGILEDKKAKEVEVIDVSAKTQIAERFVLATGTSTTHIRALAEEVQYRLKTESGIEVDHVEGYESCRWVLLDYKDVIVHVFHTEDRAYYNLERLWSRRTGSPAEREMLAPSREPSAD